MLSCRFVESKIPWTSRVLWMAVVSQSSVKSSRRNSASSSVGANPFLKKLIAEVATTSSYYFYYIIIMPDGRGLKVSCYRSVYHSLSIDSHRFLPYLSSQIFLHISLLLSAILTAYEFRS